MRSSAAALAVWITVTFLAPALGAWAMPGEWYAALRKPSWNPPSWLFGPVWTALYLMMATAAWLVWRRGGCSGQRRAFTLYLIQLALNAAWSPLFFGLKMPGLAFAEILLLLAAIVATAFAFRGVSKVAGGTTGALYRMGQLRDFSKLHALEAESMTPVEFLSSP